MNIFKIIGSILCMLLALLLGIFNNKKCSHSKKDRIDDIPRYMKRGFVNKYYGRHETEYTNIDDAQFHYVLDRMQHEMHGGAEKNKNKNKNKNKISNNNKKKHNWYNFKSWDILYNNSDEFNNYIEDRKKSRLNFLFNWDEVFNEIIPYVKNEKYETIGVIRAKSDGKTLYIHEMEKSISNISNDTYAAGIPYQLVKKYANIPGYFLFHTHPIGINADPFPSDADLYSCLLDCYSDRFFGHVVIGEYGAIVYFIKQERLEQLVTGGALKYFTYCYDLINAWNSMNNSSGPINQRDRVNFLEKWGFDMIIIPSNYFIADSYNKLFLPRVLYDRFTKTKYELLDKIKNFIKYLETEDEKKNK